MINIKLNYSEQTPGYTQNDTNWIAWENEGQRDTHLSKLFSANGEEGSFTELSAVNAKVNIEITSIEAAKRIKYVKVIITDNTNDEKCRYYHVESVDIKNDKTATLFLVMDVIGTYYTDLVVDGFVQLTRQHRNRYQEHILTATTTESKFIANSAAALYNEDGFNIPKPMVENLNRPLEYPYTDSADKIAAYKAFEWEDGFFVYAMISPDTNHNGLYHGGDQEQPAPYFIVPVIQPNKTDAIFDSAGISYFYENVQYKPHELETKIGTTEWTNMKKALMIRSQYRELSRDPKTIKLIRSPHRLQNNPTLEIWRESGTHTNGVERVKLRFSNTHSKYKSILATICENQSAKIGLYRGKDEFNSIIEPKIHTDEFIDLKVQAYNGETRTIPSNPYIDFDMIHVDVEGETTPTHVSTTFTPTFNSGVYGLDYIKTLNSRISFKSYETLMTNTPAYMKFMMNSENSFNTAVKNNKVDLAVGMTNAAIGGLTGAGAGKAAAVSPGGAAGAAIGAAGKAITGTISSISNFIKRKNAMESQIKDLKNRPDQLQGDSQSVGVNIVNARIMGAPFVSYIARPMPIATEKIAMYYHMFGYKIDRAVELKDKSDLITRERFTYTEVDGLMPAIQNSPIPHEILVEISGLFSNGLTLWAPSTQVKPNKVNDYSTFNKEINDKFI